MANHERPYSRFTRDKTQAAMYTQHIMARYALVPGSFMVNAICCIYCKSVEDAAALQAELLMKEEECELFLLSGQPLAKVLEFKATGKDGKLIDFSFLQGIKRAVILGRSSDYYHYTLPTTTIECSLVIAGIHDSMLNLPVWETYTNKRYKSRELALDIASPNFDKLRKTQYGHNILVGALICGHPDAIALKEKPHMHPKTRQRIEKEVADLQHKRYRGRPLAFWMEEKRLEVAHRISYSLIERHRKKNQA